MDPLYYYPQNSKKKKKKVSKRDIEKKKNSFLNFFFHSGKFKATRYAIIASQFSGIQKYDSLNMRANKVS
jgi:hypothetical protein